MDNIKNLIQDINTKIDQVVEEFYQQKTQEAYEHLNETIGTMLTLIDRISSMQENQKEINGEDFLNALKETLSAIEERDAILVADILKYEVQDRLNDLMESIGEGTQNE